MRIENLIAEVLNEDLQRLRINQRDLVSRMNEAHPYTPVSEAAISNWKKANRIPAARLDGLIGVLGVDSSLAAAIEHGRISRSGEAVGVDEPPRARPGPSRTTDPTGRPLSGTALQMQLQREGRTQFEQRLVELSNGEWHSYWNIGDFNDRIDFLSPTLAVELVWRSTDAPSREKLGFVVFRRALALLRLRVRDTEYGHKRTYALLLVDANPENTEAVERTFQSFRRDLSPAGIYSRMVRTPEQAFPLIAALMEGIKPGESEEEEGEDEIPF